jgi:hypothetical protein
VTQIMKPPESPSHNVMIEPHNGRICRNPQ